MGSTLFGDEWAVLFMEMNGQYSSWRWMGSALLGDGWAVFFLEVSGQYSSFLGDSAT